MARVWNDGFEKLKNRRVERAGSQLEEVRVEFDKFLSGKALSSPLAIVTRGELIKGGAEWSPQQWLPQPPSTSAELRLEQAAVLRSIYQAIAQLPDLADQVLDGFTDVWSEKPDLPIKLEGPITEFFDVRNGRSSGEKNYGAGDTPYVSSGDSSNSIIRMLSPVDDEAFEDGGLTVTAFGTASVQPWPFMARGNGGSSVRVLIPRFNMSFNELVWFAAQINIQRWRFFYARMSIKSRLEKLRVVSPPSRLPDGKRRVSDDVREFRSALNKYSEVAA